MKYNPLKIDSGSSNSNRKLVPIRPCKKNRNCVQKKLSLNTSGAIFQEHEARARGQTPFFSPQTTPLAHAHIRQVAAFPGNG